jgi:flagellar basal body rod protein FlgB
LSTISDSTVIAALRRQMTIAVTNQVASAGNLANIDTP